MPLVVVGKTNTPYGKCLVKQYGKNHNIRFVGGIYDFDKINSIRHYSYAYFHGHSVGGTNPSLLEAMASDCFLLAHDNVFNRTVIGENAYYYKDTKDVTELLNKLDVLEKENKQKFVENNKDVIRTQYSWERLVDEHEKYFLWLMEDAKKKRCNG